MASYPPPPFYPARAGPEPVHQSALRPYLGPRAHLSLSWLSQHFLALLLVLVALGFLLAQIPALVADAKSTLGAACAGVEGAVSVAVSLPHYMAGGINELNVKTVNALSEGAGTVLDFMLQALEAIVLFMIDMYRSLFLCLLDLAVHGSITVLVKGIEEAQEFVTEAIGGVRTAIQASISGINSALDHTVGLIDKIPGVDINVPSMDIPELSALENVTLPDTLITALTEFNSSIPTLDEFRSGLDSLISTPIEALRSQIIGTLSNSTIDVELLPVPAKETVALCQDLDTSWIDEVGAGLGKFVKVAIGLVVLAMVLFVAANALWERYRYRAFVGGVSAAREAWLLDLIGAAGAADPKAHTTTAQDTLSMPNLLSFLNASSHPTLFRFVGRLSSVLRLDTPSGKASLIWFLSYIAHPYAWAFLALGVVGLLVVQIQLAILDGPVRRMARDTADQGAGEFTNSVAGTLNAKMEAAGAEWANGTNRVILDVQDGINENLFGWVNDTTTTLNSTMTGFYSEITGAITDVFNGTILEDPALNLVYCLIGSKVDAVSTALTWLHNHAHLSLPTVSPSLLALSQNQTDELTASLTNPNSTVSAPSIADRMVDAYRRSLEQQRMGFLLAIGVWALVLLMGLVGVWWRANGEAAWRRWRGQHAQDGGAPAEDEKAVARAVAAGPVDEEKRAFFKPLHLRSMSAFARPRGDTSAQRDENGLAPISTHPYGECGSEANPSAASWASLIEYFKPTLGDHAAVPPPAAAAAAAQPRALVLPSLPSLPKPSMPSLPLPSLSRRTPSPSPSLSRTHPRAQPPPPRLKKPLLISRPSRPLSAFRSRFASARAAGGPAEGEGEREGEGEGEPLRGADATGERRYRYRVPAGAEAGRRAGWWWRARVAPKVPKMRGGHCARRWRDGPEHGEPDGARGEKWVDVRDEPAQNAGVLPPSSPPPPPPPARPRRSEDPFADPLHLHLHLPAAPPPRTRTRTTYTPSSRPPAVNPFATPFDAEGEDA